MILDHTLKLTDKDIETLNQDIPSDKKIHQMMKEIREENK